MADFDPIEPMTWHCAICGAEIKYPKKMYCSKECGNIAANRRQREATAKKKEQRNKNGLTEYAKWDSQRRAEGKPHISYGKLQGKRYLDEQKKRSGKIG